MDYVILDLEWNGCYSKKLNGFINEIIEFGAVKLNENLDIIGQFSVLVRPEIGKRIRSSVKNLTSITNDDLKHGSPFNYAVNKFRKFVDGSVLMTWSTSDLVTLEANCSYYFGKPNIPFLKQYVDLQAYCQDMLGIKAKNSLGLVPAAELLGLDIEDIPHHRAVGDSIVAAKCFQELYFEPTFSAHLQNGESSAFYERLNFHNTFITTLDNEAIDRRKMFFNCNLCGARTEQQKEWEAKNKSFYAAFVCPYCGNHFKGKIQFKVKYDGIVPMKKVIVPKQKEEKTEELAEEI